MASPAERLALIKAERQARRDKNKNKKTTPSRSEMQLLVRRIKAFVLQVQAGRQPDDPVADLPQGPGCEHVLDVNKVCMRPVSADERFCELHAVE